MSGDSPTINMTPIIQRAREVVRHESLALSRLADMIDGCFLEALSLIMNSKGKVIITGVGKSGHIGQKIASSFASLGTPAFFVNAAEALHGDLGMITADDIVMAISYSGASIEIIALLPHLLRLRRPLIALTGNPASLLARSATVTLDIGVREEADPRGLAPTTSAIASLAMGDALALSLAEARGFTAESFRQLHPAGNTLLHDPQIASHPSFQL